MPDKILLWLQQDAARFVGAKQTLQNMIDFCRAAAQEAQTTSTTENQVEEVAEFEPVERLQVCDVQYCFCSDQEMTFHFNAGLWDQRC